LRCAEFASLDEALSRYLKALDAPRIEHAAIALQRQLMVIRFA